MKLSGIYWGRVVRMDAMRFSLVQLRSSYSIFGKNGSCLLTTHNFRKKFDLKSSDWIPEKKFSGTYGNEIAEYYKLFWEFQGDRS